MLLLLMRHGHAVDEEDEPPFERMGDEGRWLSAKGRKVTRKVARRLAKDEKRMPVTIWTSPLVRAVETASILASELRYKDEIRVVGELRPNHTPTDLVRLLEATKPEGPVALVGHEPFLSQLAAELLGVATTPGFPKSGIIGVSWSQGSGKISFVLDPSELAGKHKN